jgi:hypothetical protein
MRFSPLLCTRACTFARTSSTYSFARAVRALACFLKKKEEIEIDLTMAHFRRGNVVEEEQEI